MNESDSNNDDYDTDLFKQAMSDVTPIKHNKASLKPKPAPIKRRKRVEASIVTDTLSDDFIPECSEYLEFMRPGVQKSLLKQLRNGKLSVEDNIDLHGQTRDQSRQALLLFIHESQQHGYKMVCIVHGKGYHSEDGRPVLKAMVNKWLQNIPEVLAFTTAQPKDGGTGATYVLLKRFRETEL